MPYMIHDLSLVSSGRCERYSYFYFLSCAESRITKNSAAMLQKRISFYVNQKRVHGNWRDRHGYPIGPFWSKKATHTFLKYMQALSETLNENAHMPSVG